MKSATAKIAHSPRQFIILQAIMCHRHPVDPADPNSSRHPPTSFPEKSLSIEAQLVPPPSLDLNKVCMAYGALSRGRLEELLNPP